MAAQRLVWRLSSFPMVPSTAAPRYSNIEKEKMSLSLKSTPIAAAATSRKVPILLFDIMDTIVRDPFYHDVPAFFGMSMKELLECKHPTVWIEFEKGLISEVRLKVCSKCFPSSQRKMWYSEFGLLLGKGGILSYSEIMVKRKESDAMEVARMFFKDERPIDLEGLKSCMRQGYSYIQGVEELLIDLKKNGYEMHSATNYPIWYEIIEEKLKLSTYLSWTFCSCLMGKRKPDPDFYMDILKHLNVEPACCIFVDDRYCPYSAIRKRNVEAALDAGFTGIQFENVDLLREDLSRLGEEMARSVYTILTIDRWESLNFMKYKTASLRPVHGRLALKFLKWIVKQPGLELNHITHLYCITTHILVRARMYDCAKSILKHLCETDLGSNSVFYALMDTYPLCNSNPAVFDLLIRVYVRKGATNDAIETFRSMGFRGFRPSVYTCNMILAAIVKVGRFESVWLFFSEILAKGICPNVGMFNILLNVLCADGKLKKASYLLRKMEESGYAPNVVSYNTVLNWYCKKGRYKEAIPLLDHMSCRGIEADVFTYNVLVDDLYGKIVVAGKIYDEMCKVNISPNRITYNALIDGHCRVGNFVEAFGLLNDMEARGLKPNEVTYGTLLNGLCKHGELDSTKSLLARMKLDGVNVNSFMYTMLMDGECRSGTLTETVKLVDKMFKDNINPDVVTYSVLVNGFCRAGQINCAKEIICKIFRSGIRPNNIVYSTLIFNLCRLGDINEAIKIYTVMLRNGHCADLFVCNLLISTLCRRDGLKAFELLDEMVKFGCQPSFYTYRSLLKGLCRGGNFKEAVIFFDKLRNIPSATDVIIYNTMVAELCERGNFKWVLVLLAEMVQNSVFPDIYTYGCLVAGLCRTGRVVTAILLLESGTVSPNQFIYSSIINGLVKIGQARAGIYFFDDLLMRGLNPDIVTLNAVIDACSRAGQLDKLKNIQSMMEIEDQLTFNMLITLYSQRGDMSKAFDLLNIMKAFGISPSEETFSSIFNGLKRTLCFQESHVLLHEMLKNDLVPTDRQYSSLITSMCKSGNMQGAFKLKDEMEALKLTSRHVAESAMVRGLVQNGKTEEGIFLLNRMLKSRIVPTVPTFTTVIHVLSKEGKMPEALDFKRLMEHHGSQPDVITYNVLITGLCRSGDIARAFELYEELKQRSVCPNTTTFSILINAVCSENDSVKGESILVDLEERGLVSRESNAKAWNKRLTDVMANIDLLRHKTKTGGKKETKSR
ncbi:hypothetical protein DH2020_030205 [Rehmannia glutinosa]|uniref:Pentatricopeptide repeat-containing protein n=1 Tax=Rehmannia glutinosa TaxID=99300 RepID=A0ABR0VPY3_REHGL